MKAVDSIKKSVYLFIGVSVFFCASTYAQLKVDADGSVIIGYGAQLNPMITLGAVTNDYPGGKWILGIESSILDRVTDTTRDLSFIWRHQADWVLEKYRLSMPCWMLAGVLL
jgi:hypothetical protein